MVNTKNSCTDSKELIWIDKTFRKKKCKFIASNTEKYCSQDRIKEACPLTCNSCPCVDSERAFKLPVGYRKCEFVENSKIGFCSWPKIREICPNTCGVCTATVTPSCTYESGIWINSEHKRQGCRYAIYSIYIEVEYLCGNKTTGEPSREQKLTLENAILNVISEYNNETEVRIIAANMIAFEQPDCCVSDDCRSNIFDNRRHLQRRRLRTPITFIVPVECYSETSCPDEILPVGDRRRISEMLSRTLSTRQSSRLISFNTVFLEYLRSENVLETINDTISIDESITKVDECIIGKDACDVETTCCGVNDDCYCSFSSESYCALNGCELRGQDCCAFEECYGSEACAPTSSPTNYPTTTHGPVW